MPRRSRKAANQITRKAGVNGPNAAANEPSAGDNRPNNPGNAENSEKLTPYQGSRRAFGIFKCTNCNRSWMSSCTWANTAQECFKCRIFIYPFTQMKLESDESKKLNKSNPDKPHLRQLCEKCLELGRFCGESNRHKKSRRRRNPNGAVVGA